MTERPYPAYGNDPKFGSAQLRNLEGINRKTHVTKASLTKAVKKLAKVTAAPLALKEARERKRPITIKPNEGQPLVLQVNALVIKSNKKHGRNDPPLRVRKGRNGENPVHAHTLELTGPSKIIHSPDKPLKCGARVWIETFHPVKAK